MKELNINKETFNPEGYSDDLHYCINKLEELYENQEYDKMGTYIKQVKELIEFL